MQLKKGNKIRVFPAKEVQYMMSNGWEKVERPTPSTASVTTPVSKPVTNPTDSVPETTNGQA